MDHICYFCLVLLCFRVRLFIDALWSPAGKGLTPLGSRLGCLIVKLSLSHWYPGSSVVLDCSIPDLCPLSYFERYFQKNGSRQHDYLTVNISSGVMRWFCC